MQELDVGDVRVFERAAELGSLMAAARSLNTSRSAASRQLARLETALGVPLLVRDSRNFSLTDQGAAFVEYARAILAAVRDARGAVERHGDALRGRLSVGAPATFAEWWLLPRLPGLLRAQPELRLSLDLDAVPDRGREHGHDLFFRAGPVEGQALIAKRVAEERQLLVASPRYLASEGAPKAPADVAAHRILDVRGDDGDPDLRFLVRGVAQRVRCTARVRASDPRALLPLAEAGLGIARLPEPLARPSLDAGRVVAVLPDVPLTPTVMFAVFDPARISDVRIRTVLDALEVRAPRAAE